MQKATWVWHSVESKSDEYVKFYDEFESASSARIKISCDSNYTLYINGQLAAFGQYADYPHFKVYDDIDITPFLTAGKNKMVAVVWYYGVDSSTYIKAQPGLIYEVTDGEGDIVCFSSQDTLCKLAEDFVPHKNKNITKQLGLSYLYDTAKYDGYDTLQYSSEGMQPATVVAKSYYLHKSPIKKLNLLPLTAAKLVDKDKKVYDLGQECAGFLHINFRAPAGETILIAYGEHIADGQVRHIIDDRDFSVSVKGCGQFFSFTNSFRRLGLRYLQVLGECEVESIGIYQTVYPLTKKPFKAKSQLQQQIYDVSVRTLELCMHEHYEDTPWREQALYAMDSRNQMLCGYYAFGEYDFARANLLLMSMAQKPDKLLPLCFPAGHDVPIPYFSLIYIVQMQEYAQFSGDISLLKINYKLLQDIAEFFLNRTGRNNLVARLKGYWNFYEWSPGLSGLYGGKMIYERDDVVYDLPLNCFVILALQSLNLIGQTLGIEKDYTKQINILQKAVRDNFYCADKGAFKSFAGGAEEHFSKLCNSLAVLSGCADDAQSICQKLTDDNAEMIDVTLSMKTFQYQALLSVSGDYAAFVESDIEKNYGYMLSNGATSFWETILGESDFANAGSLCHGWSAIPVQFFNILKSMGNN